MKNLSVGGHVDPRSRREVEMPCGRPGCVRKGSLECPKCSATYCSPNCFIVDFSENHMMVCRGLNEKSNGPVSPAAATSPPGLNGNAQASPVASPSGVPLRTSHGRGRRMMGQSDGPDVLLPPAPPVGRHVGNPLGIPDTIFRARAAADFYKVNDLVSVVKCENSGTWATNGVVYCQLKHTAKKDLQTSLDLIKAFSPSSFRAIESCYGLQRGKRILVMKLAEQLRATVLMIPRTGGAIVFYDDVGGVERLDPSQRIALVDETHNIAPTCFSLMSFPAESIVEARVQKISVDRNVTLITNDGKRLEAMKWDEDLAVPLTSDCIEEAPNQWLLDSRIRARIVSFLLNKNSVYIVEERNVRPLSDALEFLDLYYERALARVSRGGGDVPEGEVGMCKDSTGIVGRCVVQSTSSRFGERFLNVFFLDVGIVEEVKAANFLRLPFDYADVIKYSVEVVLDVPQGMRLTNASAQRLSRAVAGRDILFVHVRAFNLEGKFVVDVRSTNASIGSLMEFESVPVLGNSNGYPASGNAGAVPMWPADAVLEDLPMDVPIEVYVLGMPSEEDELSYDFCAVSPSKTPPDETNDMIDEAGRVSFEPYEARPNEIVLALHDEDVRWYRAVALPGNRVWFMDYGNMRSVTPNEVRRIPRNLVAAPQYGALFVILGRERTIKPKKEKVKLALANAQTIQIKIRGRIDEDKVYEVDVL